MDCCHIKNIIYIVAGLSVDAVRQHSPELDGTHKGHERENPLQIRVNKALGRPNYQQCRRIPLQQSRQRTRLRPIKKEKTIFLKKLDMEDEARQKIWTDQPCHFPEKSMTQSHNTQWSSWKVRATQSLWSQWTGCQEKWYALTKYLLIDCVLPESHPSKMFLTTNAPTISKSPSRPTTRHTNSSHPITIDGTRLKRQSKCSRTILWQFSVVPTHHFL